MASLLPQPKQLFQDNAWNPLVGGQIYTYEAGSLTTKDTYQDAALTIANTNPVSVNARGEVVMYGDGPYRVIAKDAAGNTLWDQDNVESAYSIANAIRNALAADLANAADPTKGDALIGVKRTLASAVASTLHLWLEAQWANVQADFGAKGDGSADDTAAIQAAISATTGKLFFPPGTYKVTSGLSWTKSNLWLVGAGEGATTISGTFAAGDIIAIGDGTANPNNSGVACLSITSTVAKTGGAAIKARNGHNLRFDHLRLDSNLYVGFDFEGGAQQFLYYLSNFEINSGAQGILVGSDGTLVQDLWISNGIISGATSDGILLKNVSGYYFDAIDLLGCGHGLSTYPDTGKQVVAGICSRLICDSSKQNGFNILTNGGLVADSTFENCWASSNGASNTSTSDNNGLAINPGTGTIDGISFPNLRATNNKGAGILHGGGSHVSFANPQIFCNSTVGSGSRSGMEISAGVSHWSVKGGSIGIGGLFSTNNQKYGISVATGASDFYTIEGVDVTGNVTGGISDGGTGSTKYIHHNPGYRTSYRGAGAITSGTSSTVIAHGLDVQPAQSDFVLSPTTQLSSSGLAQIWVSAVTATTFTVSANATATANAFFAWDARTRGA